MIAVLGLMLGNRSNYLIINSELIIVSSLYFRHEGVNMIVTCTFLFVVAFARSLPVADRFNGSGVRFCAQHRLKGMVNVRNRRCEGKDCTKVCSFVPLCRRTSYIEQMRASSQDRLRVKCGRCLSEHRRYILDIFLSALAQHSRVLSRSSSSCDDSIMVVLIVVILQ